MRRLWLVTAAVGGWLLLASAAAAQGPTPPAGPPYPPPTDGVFVYDYADILSPATEAAATRTIVAIRTRTAAEIVVYTQIKPTATTDSTRQDANDLIDQWGIGRRGFDDGLVILFNMDESRCHGQVQLYAGPGFAAAFLSNNEREAIYNNDMVPLLRQCQLDNALTTALAKIDAATTADHAQTLQTARQIDAVVGLLLSPLAFLVLVGAAGWAWLRYGKDPVYLDDPSILMPAPPAKLTAAAGAVVWEGQATPRALTVAMVDLASRGEFRFLPEEHLLKDKVAIQLLETPPEDPYIALNRRRPISAAEDYIRGEVWDLGGRRGDGQGRDVVQPIPSSELPRLAPKVKTFNELLEKHVTDNGWFREPPKRAITRWSIVAWVSIGAGAVLIFWLADTIPMASLTLLGGALIAAGVVIQVIARFMPARTMAGAMIYAMLAAYRRTLQKTMEQASSMLDVIKEPKLQWLETPDQAVVWSVALGLNKEVESVLERSAFDVQRGVSGAWIPLWYGAGFSGSAGGGSFGGGGGVAPGLFSSGGMPNFGGMTAALSTIGVSASASSGGGFGGGGGGGGGGGAGGGF